jgi:hypothetical protein
MREAYVLGQSGSRSKSSRAASQRAPCATHVPVSELRGSGPWTRRAAAVGPPDPPPTRTARQTAAAATAAAAAAAAAIVAGDGGGGRGVGVVCRAPLRNRFAVGQDGQYGGADGGENGGVKMRGMGRQAGLTAKKRDAAGRRRRSWRSWRIRIWGVRERRDTTLSTSSTSTCEILSLSHRLPSSSWLVLRCDGQHLPADWAKSRCSPVSIASILDALAKPCVGHTHNQ